MTGTKKCANFGGKWVSPPRESHEKFGAFIRPVAIASLSYLLTTRHLHSELDCVGWRVTGQHILQAVFFLISVFNILETNFSQYSC